MELIKTIEYCNSDDCQMNEHSMKCPHCESLKSRGIKLSDLRVGDLVRIEHAHKFEYGYWSCWNSQDYKYIGKKKGEYHFQHLQYETTHFSMKNNKQPSHNFMGKLTTQQVLQKP